MGVKANKNHIDIIGRVGRDPEYKDVGTGLWSFGVAVTDSWKDKSGEWQEHTDWFNVSLWGDYGARQAKKLRQGMLVNVTGRMKSRKTDDGKVFWNVEMGYGGGVIPLEKADESEPPHSADAGDGGDGLPF